MSADASDAAWAVVVGVLLLGITFAFDALVAWGVQYVGREFFHAALPFWPTFIAVIVVSFIVGKARS